jgi:hypothetical protein
MRCPEGDVPPICRKPVSGAGAGVDASMKKDGVTCWALKTEAKQKRVARGMVESHVFILIIHQISIDDSDGRNHRARGIVFNQAENPSRSALVQALFRFAAIPPVL